MNKLKKSLAAKIFASLIFSVSLIVAFVAFVLIINFYDEDVYNPGGKERARKSIIEGIIWNYNYEAMEYYTQIVQNTLTPELHKDFDFYKDYFDEKNTNYFFSIEPINEADKERFPVLTNFQTEDYQYKDVYYQTIEVYPESEKFVFSLADYQVLGDEGTLEITSSSTDEFYLPDNFTDEGHVSVEINKYDAPQEVYDAEVTVAEYEEEYEEDVTETTEFYEDYVYMETTEDGDYSVYISGNGYHYIVNDSNGTTLCLENITDFRYSLANFEARMDEKYTWYDSYAYYNPDLMEYVIEVSGSKYMEVKITSGVKSNLTANDNFYSSFWLNNITLLVDITLPAFVIALFLLLLTFVYIVVSAGHGKTDDGIVLTWFDKIPYDINVVMFFMASCIGLYIFGESFNTSSVGTVVAMVAMSIVAILVPIMLYTTAVRIKAKTIFKNTAIYKIGKIILGWIKYLWCNLNIYWKYLGIFLLISVFEVFLIFAGLNSSTLVFLIFVEKFFYAIIMAVALINMNKLKKAASKIAEGEISYEVDTEKMLWEFKKHGENLNSIKDGIQLAVEERMKSERMKTELITNVSHDIKTPLTSIISYVDLLSKEDIKGEKAKEYIEVLDRQSARLKKLIQDLIDASKASTGNMPVEITSLDGKVLLEQALAEYSEKLDNKGLKLVVNCNTENTMVKADGKLLWRTFDNIVGNVVKYAQENTRVYIDVESVKEIDDKGGATAAENNMLKVSFKNISKEELNISGEELMERFVRGDSSRNTEGSGLGLSIAKSLMEIQNGKLEIIVDGDLFKVVLLIATA